MKALLALLTEERECLDVLIEAMQAERDALARGDFHQFAALTRQKEAALFRLADVDAGRESAQAQAGFTPRAGSSGAGQQPLLQEAWEALLDRANCAGRVSRELAALVHTQLEFTREALSFLRAGSQPLYAADGSRPWHASHSRVTTA